MTRRSVFIGIGLAAFFIFGYRALRLWEATEEMRPANPQVLWKVPEFELIDSQGQPVRRDDLKGYVWIADFIFTRCAGPCPLMTRKLRAFQEEIPASEPVRFVSITVDPAFDRPDVLAEYALRWGADPARWCFLTGPPGQTVDLVVKGFFTAVQGAFPEERWRVEDLVHGTHFLLVDSQNQVRGVYDFADEGAMLRLRTDLERLVAATRTIP